MLAGCQASKGIAGLQKMPRTEPSPPGIEWPLAVTRQITFMLQTFDPLLTSKFVFWTRDHAGPRNRNGESMWLRPQKAGGLAKGSSGPCEPTRTHPVLSIDVIPESCSSGMFLEQELFFSWLILINQSCLPTVKVKLCLMFGQSKRSGWCSVHRHPGPCILSDLFPDESCPYLEINAPV